MSLTDFMDDPVLDNQEKSVKSEPAEERLFGEGTPNMDSLDEVEEKIATDLDIIEDEDKVEAVANFWFPEYPDNYVKVIKVTFNDGSTLNWPLPPFDKDPAHMYEHFVKTYVPQIIRYEALQKGRDPEEALKEWEYYEEYLVPYDERIRGDWIEDVDNTDLSEENRKWFNDKVDWLPHIARTVESSGRDVELEVEDGEDWVDDW